MHLVFYLSGENIELAKEEILALSGNKKFRSHGRLLFLDSAFNDAFKRLAFTHKIYKLLFSCSYANFLSSFKRFKWSSIYKNSFSLRILNMSEIALDANCVALAHNKDEQFLSMLKNSATRSALQCGVFDTPNKKIRYSEKELASIIWSSLKKPKVNLDSSKTPVEVIFAKNKILVCLLLHENRERFQGRRAHLRPGFSPVSLHPKLARAAVNLTGIKKGNILDPFCGTGGILIEAGLMSLKPVGYDISRDALQKCKSNFIFFKIKNYQLKKENALSFCKKFNYIATDLPYGKGTSVKDLDNLYSVFLGSLKRNLQKRAVIIFPHFVDYRKLIKESKLKIKKEFSIYIHKSLTRKIVVVQA